MPRRRRASRRYAAIGLSVVAVVSMAILTACTGGSTSAGSTAPPTPTSGTVLDIPVPAATSGLKLVDQSGKVVTLDSLHGKTVVLTDFLTLCQEICPLTSANMRVVNDAVTKAGASKDIAVIQVTVDPARDTPARLKAYQKLFGASPSWSFLTGTSGQITQFWKSFGVAYEKKPEPKGQPPKDWLTGKPLTYDVDHQDIVFVLGPDGHERWLVDGTPRVPAKGLVPSTLQSFLNPDGLANETAPPDPYWTPKDVTQAVALVSGRNIP
jgi:cytochrome oxidase Cu insertion factor (SCO1/SenC/PrrC family)